MPHCCVLVNRRRLSHACLLGSGLTWACVMVNRRAGKGVRHVPSKGGAQPRARNNYGRLRKKRSNAWQGLRAPREINASPSELKAPLAGSRQVFQDAPEQVQPVQRGEDPALTPFLQLLDDHISAHPELLQPMTTDLAAHLDDLVGAIDVDLNAPLETDGEEDKDRIR